MRRRSNSNLNGSSRHQFIVHFISVSKDKICFINLCSVISFAVALRNRVRLTFHVPSVVRLQKVWLHEKYFFATMINKCLAKEIKCVWFSHLKLKFGMKSLYYLFLNSEDKGKVFFIIASSTTFTANFTTKLSSKTISSVFLVVVLSLFYLSPAIMLSGITLNDVFSSSSVSYLFPIPTFTSLDLASRFIICFIR